MFATPIFTIALASLSVLLARADVTPSEPGPGDSFNEGSTCRTTWTGDTESTTVWKDMSIQLMSGSNLAMVHITTIATGQDGTVDGSFEYPCPDVTPNSAIYFYQYSAPGTTVKTWTTRFTIASSTGATTPPANPNQPNGDPIPWGIGALADPSKAVPPPGGSSAGPSSSGNGTVSSTVSLPSSSATTTTTLRTLTSSASTVGRTSSSASTSAASPTSSNAAVSSMSVDSQAAKAVVALITAMVFASFL